VFRLSTHPAFITVTQGIQDAFHYLGATWQKWVPVVAAIAVCNFVLYALVGSAGTGQIFYTDPYTNHVTWQPDASSHIAGLVATALLTVFVSVIGSWIYTATAISGLRNRPLTIAGVLERGILTVVAGILIGLAIAGALIAWILVTVLVPPVGILLLLAAIPVGIYLEIRLIFISLAIFDGFGPIDGMKESWRLSNGSVMRLIGWGLMAVLLAFVFSIAGGLVAAPFTLGNAAPIAQALSSLVSAIGSCFSVFMMAVLYESERARKNPAAYGLTQAPNPYGPNPYAPNPYAPNPYAAGPYAQAPNPYSQWPNPYAPNPYAQAPNPYAPAPYAPAPNPYAPAPYAPAPNPYAPAPYAPPPASQGTPPALQPWPAAQPPAQPPAYLPYQGAVPGYPGSQPPQWGAPSAAPAWTTNPNVAPAPDQPANTPPTGPNPTDPPTAG
jgi:hypothetical protein